MKCCTEIKYHLSMTTTVICGGFFILKFLELLLLIIFEIYFGSVKILNCKGW